MARRLTIHEKATVLRDVVYGASDGIVTTFAIIAGSMGASFSHNIVVVLGIANLVADGFSMAAGNYLGVKSEIEYEEARGKNNNKGSSPVKHGLYTFATFNVAGFFPLIPYIFKLPHPFMTSTLIVCLTLFIVGSSRSRFTKSSWLQGGLEMLFVGGFAALVAYVGGFLLDKYVV